jgi:hypothetical protein
MFNTSEKNNPDLENNSKIVDHSGKPIPKKKNFKQRIQSVSSITKIVIISLVAIIAAAATLFDNLETIKEYITSEELRLPA